MMTLAIVPAAAAAVALVLTGCAGGASYTAHIRSIVTVDATEVSVTAVVKNTSDTTDTPVCSVDIATASGSDLGTNTGQLSKPLKAGTSTVAVLTVDVKSVENMSQDSSSISCS